MERPVFEKQGEALAWVTADAVTRAILPFRRLLREPELDVLVDFLEMLAATHPEVRKIAKRAARTFLPLRERPVRAAAKDDDEDVPIPIALVEEVKLLERGLVGKPDLKRQEFFAPSLALVKTVVRDVMKRWNRTDFDDMVGDAWVAVLEYADEWDWTKASYLTFLWGRVRARLIDYCKRFSNCRENVFSYRWTDTVHASQFSSKESEDQLYEALDAAALSHAVGLLHGRAATPEEELWRADINRALANARASLAERQRRLIERHHDDEVELKVVANELGISYSTAREDHHKAIVTMKRALEQEDNVRTLGAPRPQKPSLPTAATALPKKPPTKKKEPPTTKKAAPRLRLVSRDDADSEDDDDKDKADG